MRKLIKTISIILSISVLFSACGTVSAEKATAQIEEYFNNNQYNECLEYVKQMETNVINQVNTSVLSLIVSEYNELLEKSKIETADCYDLNKIDNTFAENCRKLRNISKAFAITKDSENYSDFVYLHYYAEMCNFTKYSEIYSLLKSVHDSGYLVKITDAMYSYEYESDSSLFETAYKETLAFDCSSFNPREYLIEDYENAHNDTVKALKSLSNGFATNNVTVIASAMSDLENSLSEILYITDTLNTIHSKQVFILNELLNGELSTDFNTNFEVKNRDYSADIIFPLNNIFGENTANEYENSNTELNTDEKNSKKDALNIAVNAINKTKSYNGKLNIDYTQNRNIVLTSLENSSSIGDTVELAKNTINNTLDETNGIKKTDVIFNNGTNGTISLNSFIPPSNSKAVGNADGIQNCNIVHGSGGYVISITFLPEATSKNTEIKGVGSIINGFIFENSENVNDYKTTYSTAKVMLTVNNNGLLEKMEYEIAGISDCSFIDDNKDFLFNAQFSFNEKYTYSFKY